MILTLRRRFVLVALFLFPLMTVTHVCAEQGVSEPPEGYIALFNGQDLSGWRGRVGSPAEEAEMTPDEHQEAQRAADKDMRKHWAVIDGELHFDGKGHSLCSVKDYSNFELYVDWKIQRQGDSGVYLRGLPQVQIWDTTYELYFKHGSEKGSGGLWNNKQNENMPLVHADRPVGQWNTFFIRMVGDRVTVRLNGELVVDSVVLENYWDRDKPLPASGPIELQSHGSELQFRNIFFRELEPDAGSEPDRNKSE